MVDTAECEKFLVCALSLFVLGRGISLALRGSALGLGLWLALGLGLGLGLGLRLGLGLGLGEGHEKTGGPFPAKDPINSAFPAHRAYATSSRAHLTVARHALGDHVVSVSAQTSGVVPL